MAQPGGGEVVSRLAVGQCTDDAGAPRDLAQDLLERIVNRYEMCGANVGLRHSKLWHVVRPLGQRHRQHDGVGRPIRSISRELELLADRLCGSPVCAESANP